LRAPRADPGGEFDRRALLVVDHLQEEQTYTTTHIYTFMSFQLSVNEWVNECPLPPFHWSPMSLQTIRPTQFDPPGSLSVVRFVRGSTTVSDTYRIAHAHVVRVVGAQRETPHKSVRPCLIIGQQAMQFLQRQTPLFPLLPKTFTKAQNHTHTPER
jgi:hypothetical protein